METPTNDLLSIDEANELVLEHQGWAESIARSVARSWNLDWRLDGLDGAAMEALIFCARRFKPSLGVPFRGYARKRIHEAATEAARKSRGWKKGISNTSKAEHAAREVSAELFNVFPELREGHLPSSDGGDGGGGDDDVRGGIRQLLVGATLIAAKQGMDHPLPDDMMDYKKMINMLATMEAVHQLLMWKVYWEGLSLRNLASDWDTDGLNVIREHKVVVEYLHKNLALGKQFMTKPKVRPGLKEVSLTLKRDGERGPFTRMVAGEAV